MKKSISKLISAGIALALALPFTAGAETPAIAKKASFSRHTAVQKVQDLPKAKTKLAAQHRTVVDHTVNGKMLRNQFSTRSTSLRHLPALAGAPVATSAPLLGCVIFSDPWVVTGEADYGVFTLDTDGNGGVSQLFPTSSGASFGGVAVDGKYYLNDLFEFLGSSYIFHEVYDLETGEQIAMEYGESVSELATDMTYDPKTGKVYGCFYNEQGNGYQFATFDLETFTSSPICDLDMLWNACACDKDGNLYAIDRAGIFYSVDKTSGNMTEIGSTGVEPYYTSSATIDPKTGVMFWTVSPLDEKGYLYTVDTATGIATLVSQFVNNDEVAGLCIPAPSAEDGAPAAIADLAVNFPDGTYTGTVTFTAPATLFDGSTPTDNALQYTILVNGTPAAQGATTYGAEVSAEITVDSADMYTITVYVSNAAGDGPKSKVEIWVGEDAPVNPENVVLAYANGTMTLTWDAVETGVHNGYLGAVTYTVTRIVNNEDATVVAEGLTECTFSEAIAEPEEITSYFYAVRAVAGNSSSQAIKSNSIVLGSIVPPYSVDFTTASDIEGFTVIDANEDGKTWSLVPKSGVRAIYNSSAEMDDWLVTPPMKLEGGKIYTFSFVAKAESNTYPERVEAGFAASATAEALGANIIVEPTELTADDTTLAATVIPEADGTYYFGIHGISYADQYYLYVTSLSVSAGRSASMPAAPEDLTVVPDADGGKTAVVTFKAPAKAADGTEITALESATITANGEKVAEIAAPAPGAEISQTIEVPASGTYTIAAYVTSEAGDGLEASAKVFIGINIPAAPTNVQAVEIGNTGKVVVSWDAPTTDRDGNPINPALITYTVVNYNDDVLAEGVTGTSVEVTAWEGEGQTFDYFDVTAVTEAGSSKAASSPMIAIGTPYDMPVVESFTDGDFDCGMGAIDDGAEWYVFNLETLESVLGFGPTADADGTNGLAMMYGTSLYAMGDLFTGKINITGKAPVLSFSYFTQAEDDANILGVFVTDENGDSEEIGEYEMVDGEVGTWTNIVLDLDAYQGQTVQIHFIGMVLFHTTIFIDNIKVYNLADYDLTAAAIEAPAEVAPGEEFEINVEVANTGANDVDSYEVELRLNGEVLATENCGPLAAGTSETINFAHTFSPIDAEENVFEAVVVLDKDEVEANNNIEFPVILVLPNYPAATNLTAEDSAEGVKLAWDEPDMNDLPKMAVTDDFEEYESFAVEAGEWTLVDVDGAEIGGIQGITLPVASCAFFVMDNSDENTFNQSFAAHSGNKYMCTMYNSNGSKQSDWMISPALSGEAQTISLYAKSYTSSYGLETLSIYYSTTDKDPASFELISTNKVPADWTEYTAALPAGAKYFAIVCESQDVFMLFVDDVTYIPAIGEAMELSLVGYNVYRDGMKINDEPVAETEYTDAVDAGVHEYVVTVVYEEGESAPSNVASLTTSINSALSAASVKVLNRQIVVSGAEGNVSVYTADGKTVYSAAAEGRNVISVAPGVYMVKSGNRINKVIVR